MEVAKMCTQCGGPLPVQTGRGRRRVKCATCAPPRKPKPQPVTVMPTDGRQGGLLESVRAELSAAGVEASAAGQAALLLAERVEFGENSGSAVAQMVRQLHDSLARALSAEEPAVADPVTLFRDRLRGA